MSVFDTKALPGRLVDYILVIGSDEPPAQGEGVLCPKLLRRIPERDVLGSPLPPDVVFFCQPDGCYICDMTREEMMEQQKLFIFCLTEKDSNVKRYGTCLNFFRPCRGKDTAPGVVPGKESTAEAAGGDEAVSSAEGGGGTTEGDGSKPKVYHGVLTSVCLLSHHTFFSSFKEILMTFRDIVERLQIDGETAIDMENGWRRLIDPSLVDSDPCAAALHVWIKGLLSAPTPLPGKTCIELELAIMPTLTLAYPDTSRFPLVDFPLHLPVDLLGPKTLIEVLTIVLLEQKVVFQSRDYNLLSMCVLAVVSLLFPLEYLFPIIPLLPTSLPNAETLLLAPSPYVIGVPASFFHPDRNVLLPEDVFHIDLDSGQIDRPSSKPDMPDLPPLPEKLTRVLVNRLERCLEIVHTMPFPMSPSPSSKEPRGQDSSTPKTSQTEKPNITQPKKMASTGVDDSSHPLAAAYDPWPLSASKRTSVLSGVAVPTTPGGQQAVNSPASTPSSTVKTVTPGSEAQSKSPTAQGEDEIDGNLAADIVAVDVHIRVAFVQFLLSDDMLANYRRFLRTVRLHSRPVVMLQKNGFLKSIRGSASQFLESLADTQALETFGEFELNPTTTVHWRIQQDITNAVFIGDKHKWFKDKLSVIPYSLYEGCEALSTAMLQEKSLFFDSDSDSDSLASYTSSSDSSMILITDADLVGDDGPETIKIMRRPYDEAVNAPPAVAPWEKRAKKEVTDSQSRKPYGETTGAIIEQPVLSSVDFTKAKTSSPAIKARTSEIVDAGSPKAVKFTAVADSMVTADISAVTVHVRGDTPGDSLEDESESSRPASRLDVCDKPTTNVVSQASSDAVESHHGANPQANATDLETAAGTEASSEDATADIEPTASTGASTPKDLPLAGTTPTESAEGGDPGSLTFPELPSAVSSNETTTTDVDSTVPTPSEGTDLVDFYASPIAAQHTHQATKGGKAVKPVKPLLDNEFEIVSTPVDYPSPKQPAMLQSLAEEFDNVAEAAMAFVGTVAQETPRLSTDADGVSRDAIARHGNEGVRLKQIRMVNHRSKKHVRQSARSDDSESSDTGKTRQHPSKFFNLVRPDRTALHTQLQRQQSNIHRRPLPIRTRSLSFYHQVDSVTGRVSTVSKNDKKGNGSYDEAVFGARLGHGDMVQEEQVSEMEFRWMKSQRKYFASATSGDDHLFNPFPTFRRSITDRTKGLPASKRLNNFALEQPSADAINTSENQRFIYESTTAVLDGKGIPWYKMRKLNGLLTTECMRHAVLNTICEATGVASSSDGVPDIWLYKPVYKGILTLMRAVLSGIENSVATGGQETISSTYHFLEVCYSHFTGQYAQIDVPTSASRQDSLHSSDSQVSLDDTFSSGKGAEDDAMSPSPGHTPRGKKRSLLLPPQALPLEQRSDRGVIGLTGRSPNVNPAMSPDRTVNTDKSQGSKDDKIRRADPHPNIIHPATKAEESRRQKKGFGSDSSAGAGTLQSPASESSKTLPHATLQKEPVLKDECGDRRYLYEEFLGKGRCSLWDNMEFWETFFGDIVAQERQAMGLNDNPVQLIERFRRLSSVDRVCLEHEEDLALTGLLVNMAAFMVAMGVKHSEITGKIRRLVGRAHIGLQFSQHVYDILRVLEPAKGNAFELWPLRSRQIHRQTFMVHQGETVQGDMCIIEVSDLAIVLNDFTGEVRQRWFYEDIVRANYHPSSCVLCMWVREEDGVVPYNFWCVKKGRLLYDAVENYINGSSAPAIFGSSITGQFPVRDAETGDAAVLTLSVDGVSCRFSQGRPQLSFDLANIENCEADGDIFVLFIADDEHELQKYRFESLQVSQIVQTIMNIFSVLAAQAKKGEGAASVIDIGHVSAADVALLHSDISLPPSGMLGGDRQKSYYTDEGDSSDGLEDPI